MSAKTRLLAALWRLRELVPRPQRADTADPGALPVPGGGRFDPGSTPDTRPSPQWTALCYFSLYRLIVCLLLLLLFRSGYDVHTVAKYNPMLFSHTLTTYLAGAVGLLVLAFRHWPAFTPQRWLHVLLDIGCLSLLIYSSHGLDSGYGMLMIVSVAGNSMLGGLKTAVFIAALASLTVLGSDIYVTFSVMPELGNHVHAGFLGMVFFLGSITAQTLASRALHGESLARERGEALRQVSQLNEQIVRRMALGVLVTDIQQRVRLYNDSARTFLQCPIRPGQPLSEVCAAIQQRLTKWQTQGSSDPETLYLPASGTEVLLHCVTLGSGAESEFSTLIYLENVTDVKQRAQRMKLSSLGSLTASIAHEIRNPLGAISNAAQLLQESAELPTIDQRLADIILDNSTKVNRIIENILGISRHQPSLQEKTELWDWLHDFVAELKEQHQLQDDDIHLCAADQDVVVRVDRSQLRQIVGNLSENALRYSQRKPLLEFSCGIREQTGQRWLDVRDQGRGIPQALEERLFEPFMTTEKTGSGMGLYIARELSEANHAELALHFSSAQGSCFRINFNDPDSYKV